MYNIYLLYMVATMKGRENKDGKEFLEKNKPRYLKNTPIVEIS